MILKISFWNPQKYKNNFIKIFDTNTYDLYFKIENNPVALLWIKKLQDSLNYDFILETRWTGFNLKERSKEILINKLKRCIDTINNSFLYNQYGYYIDPISDDYTTEEHNRIHHHFEILIGQTWKPSDWWKKILEKNDLKIINAVRGLNDITHEIEGFKFNLPFLQTTFVHKKIKKDELPVECEDYFNLQNDFGDIKLHYAQLGKTWVEVILDNDNEIFESNINPLKLISGEFDIVFNNFMIDSKKITHEIFFEYIYSRLKKIGKNPKDKSLRLGNITVAKIILEEKKDNIIKNLRNNSQIYSISIIDEENMFSKKSILERRFKPYYDPY